MLAGITYDLRDYYKSLGFSEEEAAEFDSIVTIDAIDNTLKELGFDTDRIGNISQLAERLSKGDSLSKNAGLSKDDRWDFIFNIAEGLYGIGREAQIPALCDAYKIPYTFSDPCILSLTLNKELTKRIVRDLGLATPDFKLINSLKDLDAVSMDFPLFAKPFAEGTSKGIDAMSVIKDKKSLITVCDKLLTRFRQPVLVETYLPGREFTVGIIGTGDDARAIGIMEVILNRNAEAGVYSYQNKENCEELVIYRLATDETALKSAELALNAWRGIGCFDSGRVDVRCDAKGVPNFIEVNPLAGLHPEHSDLPIICTKAGISYTDLVSGILNSCFKRYNMLDQAPEKIRNTRIKVIDFSGIKKNKKSGKTKSSNKIQIIILHQHVPEDASEDEKDVLVQAGEISETLKQIDCNVLTIPVTLDLEALKRSLSLYKGCSVFNLVESVGGSDRLASIVPALLDSLNMKYTGSRSNAISLSGDKVAAKRLMNQFGIPTPAFYNIQNIRLSGINKGKYIIKSVHDHASAGISADSIISINKKTDKSLAGKILRIAGRYNSECFLERYIDGREFNISILAGVSGPEVLPIAEIRFKNYPKGKARIVDYNAKWDVESTEYKSTVRIFENKTEDKKLFGILKKVSLKCWDAFGLDGYARVDFRVDKSGNPWVLEVNTNPCLSSDAGFMAAAAEKGIDRHEVIKRILNNGK